MSGIGSGKASEVGFAVWVRVGFLEIWVDGGAEGIQDFGEVVAEVERAVMLPCADAVFGRGLLLLLFLERAEIGGGEVVWFKVGVFVDIGGVLV